MIAESTKDVTHSISFNAFAGIIFSALSTICIAIMSFLQLIATTERKKEVSFWNDWFRRKWDKIQVTPWRGLPATVIEWVLRVKGRVLEYQEGLGFLALASAFLIPLCFGTTLWISYQRAYPEEHVHRAVAVAWMLLSLVYTAFAFLIVPGETRDLASFSAILLPTFAYMQVASRNIQLDRFTLIYIFFGCWLVLLYLHYRFRGLRFMVWPTATILLVVATYQTERHFPITGYTLRAVSLFGVALVITSVILKMAFVVSNEKGSSDRFQLFATSLLALFSFAGLFVLSKFIHAMLSMSLPIAVLMAILIVPVCGIITSGSLQSTIGIASYTGNTSVITQVGVRPNASSTLVFLGISVGLSFVITLLALFLGHLLAPGASLPQTFQMLLSNVICDSLTIVVTLSLLEKSVGSQKRVSVRSATIFSLVAAGLLAATSLKAGLSFTPAEISVRSLIRVMIGRSTEGGRWQFGPYFWAMHTTFLPCLAFAWIVFITWCAKLSLRPLEWFFNRGADSEINPISMTSALFGCFAAVFGALATFVGILQLWRP